ncbi:CAAX amino terminal protease family protein [Zea mays]|jgi:hypothetical protein|uniref:CAAX amino terminal protease family protein n=1 Tax=Zea mays TaxID=4577 RepID=A0A1D6KNZ9_MAIZE|nr:CAAX amino terminal protease family protein [Zea mays]
MIMIVTHAAMLLPIWLIYSYVIVNLHLVIMDLICRRVLQVTELLVLCSKGHFHESDYFKLNYGGIGKGVETLLGLQQWFSPTYRRSLFSFVFSMLVRSISLFPVVIYLSDWAKASHDS